MAQYGADGRVAATQVGDEASHGSLLGWRSRIGYAARWRETALIADADAVGIVATGMGSHALLGAAGMDHAVTGDVVMVADVSPAIHHHVVVLQLLQGVGAIAASCAAMHHDHIDSSHISRWSSSPVTLGRSSPRPAPPRGRSKWLL